MRRKRKNDIFLIFIGLILTVFVCLTALFFRTRELVSVTAKNQAKTLMLQAANRAVEAILTEQQISYDRIARLSKEENGKISGLEIDIAAINLLKSQIAGETARLMAKSSYYQVKIPVGSFFGNEYLTGIGPKIPFTVQLSATAQVNYQSVFCDAGINQVLHQILISVDLDGTLIAVRGMNGISAHTDVIAAQTVIVGETPDAFTNVREADGSDRAGEVFDYSVLESPKEK